MTRWNWIQPLFPFLKPFRVSIVIALALMLVEVAVELAYPKILAAVIDDGILPGSLPTVLFWGAVMVLLALLSFASGIMNTFYAADVSQGFSYRIREAMFRRLQSLTYANFQQFSTASLVTRLSADVNQLQNTIYLCVRLFLRVPLLIVGSVLMALTVNVQLALVLVLIAPLILLILGWTIRRGFGLFRQVQARLDQLSAILRENLLGMRLIRSYGRGEHETNRFAQVNEALRRQATGAMRLTETVVPCLLIVMNFCVLFVIWFGSKQVAAWQVQAGEVVAIVNYAIRVTHAYAYMNMLITDFTRSRAALSRIFEVLGQGKTERDDPLHGNELTPTQQVAMDIEFDRVGFYYTDRDSRVLDAIRFRIPEGGTAVLMGATGSGKTTLLQLLPRIYEPEEGHVRIGGSDVRQYGLEQLRGWIGYVPQEVILFSGTIRDNLRWGNEQCTDAEMIEAAKQAQLHDEIVAMPAMYDTVLEAKGGNLSGGQRQRLSIARALLRKPRLLLLDDCTSALDTDTELRLLAALRQVQCTTLLVTQKTVSARRADLVILLDKGRQLAQGTHKQLLDESAEYRFIVQSQLHREEANIS